MLQQTPVDVQIGFPCSLGRRAVQSCLKSSRRICVQLSKWLRGAVLGHSSVLQHKEGWQNYENSQGQILPDSAPTTCSYFKELDWIFARDFSQYIVDSTKGTEENPSPDQDSEEEMSPENQDLFPSKNLSQIPRKISPPGARRGQPESLGWGLLPVSMMCCIPVELCRWGSQTIVLGAH